MSPAPAFEIRADDLRGVAVARLLQQHLDFTSAHSPPESRHALDLGALRAPEVSFWVVERGGPVLGCGALKEIDTTHAELKSMCTAATHRRQGVAAALLQHILEVARSRAYLRVSLETGSTAAFAPAHRLYAGFGFIDCAPCAGYAEDPHSRFMTLSL
jgi:putative acetyltransferase